MVPEPRPRRLPVARAHGKTYFVDRRLNQLRNAENPHDTLHILNEGDAMTEPRFSLGRIVATPGAIEALEAAGQIPWDFLGRHLKGDWGELDEEDKAENEASLKRGSRLLSAYHTKNGRKLWVITEADRSVTTLLLPEEY